MTLRAGLSNASLALGTLVAVRQRLAAAHLGDVVQTPLGAPSPRELVFIVIINMVLIL